jgi:uncharacterized protein (TIGR02996 family)
MTDDLDRNADLDNLTSIPTLNATEQQTFLRTIRENPADDTARLVYADWLQDHDAIDIATFIRLQIAYQHADDDEMLRKYRKIHGILMMMHADPKSLEMRPGGKQHDIINKPHENRAWWDRWMGSLPPAELDAIGNVWLTTNISFAQPSLAVWDNGGRRRYCHWMFSRGFLANIVCHADHWRRFGPYLVANHPIESVTVDGTSRANVAAQKAFFKKQFPTVRSWYFKL